MNTPILLIEPATRRNCRPVRLTRNLIHREPAWFDEERARQLADLANENHDAAECAAVDLTREFPKRTRGTAARANRF